VILPAALGRALPARNFLLNGIRDELGLVFVRLQHRLDSVQRPGPFMC
jgi:hypothetical protein